MANMHFKADLLPSTDLGYSLGSSDERWKINGLTGGPIEYIVDTKTGTSSAWTGVTKDSTLEVGKVIAFKVTNAPSGNASLQLTFTNPPEGGATATAAIPVYLNNTRVTTHYANGSVILMVYDGTNWCSTDYWNSNSRDAGYGKITPQQSDAETAITTNTTQLVAATYNEAMKVAAGNKWVQFAGTNGASGADVLTVGHSLSGVTAGNYGDSTAQTPGYGSTFNVPYISVDAAGHVTGISTHTVKIPASDNTDTKVTTVGNHYTPSAETNSELTASLSGNAGAYTINTEYTVLTGVKAQRDSKGHVTGLTYTAQKIKDTNTTYTLPVATNDTLGGVKPWYSHTAASTGPTTGSNATAVAVNAITSTANKYYAIESDSNGRLFVNVPWSNTWTKLSTSAAGYVGTKLPGNTTTFLRGDGTWNAPSYPVTSVATKTGAVTLGTLTIGNKTYNGSDNITVEIADLGLASTTTFLGITSTDLSNGSTTSPVNIVIGPTTGNVTPSNGSVVMKQDTGEEYIWTGNKWNLMGLASSWALANHIHGNILNNGTITSDTTIGNGQHLVVTDSNNKVSRSSLSFDTTKTTEYLTHAGTWATPPNDNTTYTFANGTNGFTVTPSGGTAQTVTVTPSIANNVTGSGSSGYLAKFNGTNTITSGPALGSSTTTFLNNAGSWTAPTGDHKVKQNAAIASSGAYPIILATSTATTEQIESVNKTSTLTYNPSTQRLHTPILEVTSSSYGAVLPESGTEGQLFFQTSDVDQTPDNRYVKKAGDTMTGALKINGMTGDGYGQIRIMSSNYGVIMRNDDYAFYFLLTSQGDSSGTWNTLRPFTIALDTGYIQCNKLYGAVWNDYAEFRETKKDIEPGRCIRELGDDTLELTTERLMRGCEIVSDTFGFAIGKTEKAQTPTAASGRVLAYLYEDRELAKEKIGWPVCSGPNGTVSIMTEEEEQKYPSRIIGTISAVPDYEIWHGGNEGTEEIHVNGRIWIRVR